MARFTLDMPDKVLDRALDALRESIDASSSPDERSDLALAHEKLSSVKPPPPEAEARDLEDACPLVDVRLIPPLDAEVQEVLLAILESGVPMAVMLCGARHEVALALLRGLLAEAKLKALLVEVEQGAVAAASASIERAKREGKITVIYEKSRLMWGRQVEGSAWNALSHEMGRVLIIVEEQACANLSDHAAGGCLLIDLSSTHGDAVLYRREILRSVEPGARDEAKELIMRLASPHNLRTLSELCGVFGERDPKLVPALLRLSVRGKDSGATGHQGTARKALSREAVEWIPPSDYHVDLINTDTPPEEILAVMRRGAATKGARLLLHGPSGTGKTEFVKWLAHKLDRPLMQRSAGELLHWRLGKLERTITANFQEASRTTSILLIDEAESLMMSRERNGSWSTGITITNAFLTELDAFQGLFVCCTNHLDLVDQAFMRRMTVKVGFNPLRSGDRVTAFLRELARFSRPLDDESTRRLAGLAGLCLGDLGNVRRRIELLGDQPEAGTREAMALVELLAKEVQARGGGEGERIGFV